MTKAELSSRIDELEARLEKVEDETSGATATVSAVAKQVANNAKIANENSAKDMTRRGACGYEQVQTQSGWAWRARECKTSDLGDDSK